MSKKQPIHGSYRIAECCERCVKCVIVEQAYYDGGNEYFCNANGDKPEEPDWNGDEDKASKQDNRLHQWKMKHSVAANGICDKHEMRRDSQ